MVSASTPVTRDRIGTTAQARRRGEGGMHSSLRAPPASRGRRTHRYTICKVSRPSRHRLWRRLGWNRSVAEGDWVLVDGTPLSELDFARLKAKQAPDSAAEPLSLEWQRASPNRRHPRRATLHAV